MSTQPRFWAKLERHPLSAEYDDLTGGRWTGLLGSIEKHGFDKSRPIILHVDPADGKEKVLDGWQRQRACIHHGVQPVYARLPKGTDPEAYVERHNDWRRHETEAEREKRVEARRARVAAAHAAGESLRKIAENEGVSQETIRSDVAKNADAASGVNPLTPGNFTDGKNTEEHPSEPPKQPERVTGRDGKSYPKSKPVILCERCRRVGERVGCERCAELRQPAKPKEGPKPAKSGKARFNEKVFDKPYGELTRAIDRRAEAMGKGQLPKSGPAFKANQEALQQSLSSVMQASTLADRMMELMSVLLSQKKEWCKQ